MKSKLLILAGTLAMASSLVADSSSASLEIVSDAIKPTTVTSSPSGMTAQASLDGLSGLTSSATLQLASGQPAIAPFSEVFGIETQPMGTMVFVGAPISLSVVATGTDAVTYQWSKDGVAIEGAIAATLDIPMAAETDAGAYTVTVTTSAQSVVSAAADVAVMAVPVVTGPDLAIVGAPFDLTAAPVPEGAVIEWSANGVVVEGASTAMLSVAAAALTDAGPYTVTVTVGEAVATSAAFDLTVVELLAPVVTGPASVTEGDSFDLIAAPLVEGATVEWTLDDAVLAGVVGDTYSVASSALIDAGSYAVSVTLGGVTVSSEAFVLVVEELPAGTYPLPDVLASLPGSTFVEDRSADDMTVSVYSTIFGDVFVDASFAEEGFVYSTTLGWIFPSATVGDSGAYIYSTIIDSFIYTDASRVVPGGFFGFVFGEVGEAFFPDFNDASDNQIWVYQFSVPDWVSIEQ